MSAKNKRPSLKTYLISLVLTLALVTAAYYIWTYANFGVRQLPSGKEASVAMNEVGALLRDFRFFVGLLAVFVGLTILDRIISFIVKKFSAASS